MPSPPVDVRFSVAARPALTRLRRWLTPVLIVASFVPGIVIIVASLAVGPDRLFALFGGFFLVVPGLIW